MMSKICHPPLPREPYTWLLISSDDDDDGEERHMFYSLTEDRYYIRSVPELHNKYVTCCYGGCMVLEDKSTTQFSILNISTMEKLQLPIFHNFIHPLDDSYYLQPDCILSSPVMDRNCRIILFDTFIRKFKSCHLGDSEFIERELVYNDDDGGNLMKFINFRGKLYALTCFSYDLIAADFSDPDLHFEQVVSGQSLERIQCPNKIHATEEMYLVESCEDLLFIIIDGNNFDEISEVYIFRADFSSGEWVEHETLGDRAIFLDSVNTFSSPASAFGLKSNALYWIRGRLGCCTLPSSRHLYMYDIEDKSVSVSLPCPIVGTHSLLSWFSLLPITTANEDKLKDTTCLLFEAVETNFNRNKTTNLQIEKPRKTKNKLEIWSSSLWADLPNDLLSEIFLRLLAGDRVAFHLVCRSWYSISPPSMTSQQQLILPLKESESSRSDIFSSPFLMCPDKKACHPIYREMYSMDYFPDLPEANIRTARDGWLLLVEFSFDLYFYNPFTKAKIALPEIDALSFRLIHFSAPPTSTDFLVVAVATMYDKSLCICFMKSIDEGWTYSDISPQKEFFRGIHLKVFVLKGLCYFLGPRAKLLIFYPNKNQIRLFEGPGLISDQINKEWGQEIYLLESDDGKLIMVFVGAYGSSVYTFEWNVSTCKWDILGSLGNRMLFLSQKLSLCKRATVSGTGNKIYFPRVAGDYGQILFYSLATRKYHTFEMGTTYPNFLGSKFYPLYNGWFMP